MPGESYKPIRNPVLEENIRQDIDNLDSWTEYAEWLQGKQDPRGEVMFLELVLERGNISETERINVRNSIEQLYKEYRDVWIGQELLDADKKEFIRDFYDQPYLRYGFLNYIYIEKHVELLASFQDSFMFLREIGLSDFKCTRFPEWILDLTQLRKLKVNFTKLTSLPEQIAQLDHLLHLDLSRNQLSSVPGTIGGLYKLQSLNLGHNQLLSVPDTIGKLKQLKDLDLSYNNLTAIPEEIGRLRKLENLSLERNKIRSLPPSMNNLESLQYLSLEDNSIKAKLPMGSGEAMVIDRRVHEENSGYEYFNVVGNAVRVVLNEDRQGVETERLDIKTGELIQSIIASWEAKDAYTEEITRKEFYELCKKLLSSGR